MVNVDHGDTEQHALSQAKSRIGKREGPVPEGTGFTVKPIPASLPCPAGLRKSFTPTIVAVNANGDEAHIILALRIDDRESPSSCNKRPRSQAGAGLDQYTTDNQ